MKKIILFMLSISMLISSLPAYAAGGAYEKVFSSASDDMTGYEITEGYTITDDGIFDKNLSRSVIYKGQSYSGKYEYEIEFKNEFENSSNIIFNYVDSANYNYIEILPEAQKASLKTKCAGKMSTGGLYDIQSKISTDTWVTAKIISNGGRGVSLLINTGSGFEEVFTDKFLRNGSQSGFVGFEALDNPMAVKRISVQETGEADFVEPEISVPSYDDVPQDTDSDETAAVERDDEILKLMISLGIMQETANGTDGSAYVSLPEMVEIASNLKYSYSPEPEQNVTQKMALDFIFDILRCTIKMNDNEKYSRALSMGLLRKTAYTGRGYINRYDLAQMIYNAFDKPMFYSENHCLFDDILKLRIVKGQVTDNGITALTSKSEVGIGNVKVGGVVLKNKTTWTMNEIIGRMVEGYYNEEDELLYVKPLKNEAVLEFDASMVDDFSNYTFLYEHIGTGRLKKAQIIPGASVIYNGEYMASYPDELFENIEYGSIKLISTDGSDKYDTVIAESFENFVISSILSDELAIFNAAYDTKDENNRLYKLSLKDYDFIEILDGEGNNLKFEELKVDDVLSVAVGSGYIKAIVSTQQESNFILSEMSQDEEGRTVIGNGNVSYLIASSYFKAYDKIELEMGTTYTFLVNHFGDIVWTSLSTQYMYETGCLARVTTDDVEEVAYIHLYEADGEVQHFRTAEKVRLLDKNGTYHRYNYKEVFGALNGLNEVVVYKLNFNDEITEIQLPHDGYMEDCPNKIMRILDAESGEYRYKDVAYAFGYKYFFGNVKRMFAVAQTDVEDPYRYGVVPGASSFTNYDTYKMKCYSTSSEYLVDYAIIYDYKTNNSWPVPRAKEFIVTDVSYELRDEEPMYKFTGFTTAETTLWCEPEVAENAYDIFTYSQKDSAEVTPKRYKVQKGDIIKYTTDYVTGDVMEIVIIYRDTELNPETGSKGWLLGSTDTSQNPFAISSTYGITLNPGREAGSRRFFYGWIYDNEGGVLTVTNQDLSHYGNYYKWDNPNSTAYISEYHTNATYTSGATVQENPETGKLEVKSGKTIRTFKKYGQNCSRVLVCATNTNNHYNLIVLNN